MTIQNNILRVARGIVIEDFASTLKHGGIVTDVLYVHPDGDGTDGLTWETAYATFLAAYTAAGSDANDFTLILVSAGTFDFAVTAGQAIAKNIAIKGAGRDITIFKNTHATNTYVFSVSKPFYISDCTIYRMTTCNGINLASGAIAHMKNVKFDMESEAAAAGTALSLTSVTHSVFEDIYIAGDGTNTIGIDVNTSNDNIFKNIIIYKSAAGIKMQNAASDDNIFKNIDLHDCTIGIDLDAGNNAYFTDINFIGCTTTVDDEVGDAHWINVKSDTGTAVNAPATDTGTAETTGNGAYSAAWTELLAAADFMFKVVGFSVESDAADIHLIKLSSDGGTTVFYSTVWQPAANNIVRFNIPTELQRVFEKGTAITCDTWGEGGANTLAIWLHIVKI